VEKEEVLRRLWTRTIHPLLEETTGAFFPDQDGLVKVSERMSGLDLFHFFSRVEELMVEGYCLMVFGDRCSHSFSSMIFGVRDGVLVTIGVMVVTIYRTDMLKVTLTPV